MQERRVTRRSERERELKVKKLQEKESLGVAELLRAKNSMGVERHSITTFKNYWRRGASCREKERKKK